MTSEFRVTALYYRFASETERDDFTGAAPWAGTLGVFDGTLSDGILKAVPTVEFRLREAAREALGLASGGGSSRLSSRRTCT